MIANEESFNAKTIVSLLIIKHLISLESQNCSIFTESNQYSHNFHGQIEEIERTINFDNSARNQLKTTIKAIILIETTTSKNNEIKTTKEAIPEAEGNEENEITTTTLQTLTFANGLSTIGKYFK